MNPNFAQQQQGFFPPQQPQNFFPQQQQQPGFFPQSGGFAVPQTQTVARILCCLCGATIPPNPSNMCPSCIRTQVDITSEITKAATIFQCRQCARYLGTRWIACDLESRELLALLLKKIHGIGKGNRLVDASFVWTEPHSRRIKVKLTIQAEVLNGTLVQQSLIVEFEVHNQQCTDCQRSFTPHEGWKATVQLRQKVGHKRTFLYLEQLILKHGAHGDTMKIKEVGDGLDFYFGSKQQASKFCDFITKVTPSRIKQQSQKLISQDYNNNTALSNSTYSLEIPPVCKDDVVCLPSKLAHQLGNISPLVIIHKISSLIHIIDPFTLQHADISPQHYWMNEFGPIAEKVHLIEYMVIDVEPKNAKYGPFSLADVTVVRSHNSGVGDHQITTLTHLGNILRCGDTVLGYDLMNANMNVDLSPLKGRELPETILVKKKFSIPRRRKRRVFKLKRLEVDTEMTKAKAKKNRDPAHIGEEEYEDFLRDLEEDPDMRSRINLYKKGAEDDTVSVTTTATTAMETGEEDPTFPGVKLEELVENLRITDDVQME
eukprot:c12952_g1_i1.p1 GENE.c12952_g1_i1~~c12952_g1_i1.p1  ORF type:complete len:544 (-),score=218.73 c12952_g1_i1:31-1662(-)